MRNVSISVRDVGFLLFGCGATRLLDGHSGLLTALTIGMALAAILLGRRE